MASKRVVDRNRGIVRAGVRPIESLEGRLLFAVHTWDGGGTDDNWTTAANWSEDVAPTTDGTAQLVFGADGAARKTTNNNFPAGTVFEDITFRTSGWTLNGAAIVLGDDITAASSGTNTVNLNVTMTEIDEPPSSFIAGTPGVGGATLVINGSVTVQENDRLGLRGVSTVVINGAINGPGGLLKDASGEGTLTADSGYAGGTTIEGGSSLTLNHTGSGSATGTGQVTNNGDIRGSGRIAGPLLVRTGGDVFPGVGGSSTGILSTGNLTFQNGTRYSATLAGATAGTGHDQIAVTGTVTIGATTELELTPPTGFAPGNGTAFTIISNDGSDAVAGTFANLPEGGRRSAGGQTYQISYTGGDGNDVVLTAIEANDPAAITAPDDKTTLENTAVSLGAIVIDDPDAGTAPIQMTLAATNGTVSLAGTGGLSFVTGNGTDNATVVFTGSQADINTALANVTFKPNTDFNGNATVTITSNDLGNTGPGGATNDPQQVSATVDITVNDAATQPPVAADDTATRGIGQAITINVRGNDTDPLSRPLTVSIRNQPTGGTATVNAADQTITYTGQPGFNGNDTFTYRVDNGQGGTDDATVRVITTGIGLDQDPDNAGAKALFIVGTDGAEFYKITKKKTQIRVLNGKAELAVVDLPTGSVIVQGNGGNDNINVGVLKNSPARIYGGDGDDTIKGANANDILVGGVGNDNINGGRGNDLIIGGGGADKIAGLTGDDILIAGPTDFNDYTFANTTTLRDLLNAWNGGADYAAKVAAITTGTGNRFNAQSLENDNDVDNLAGASGNDLYIANREGSTLDVLKGVSAKRNPETVIELL